MAGWLVGWAMRESPRLFTDTGLPDSTARAVLVVLCEHARDDGTNAHPSAPLIEYEAELDARTVRRALGRLQDAKVIEHTSTLPGGTKVWTINHHLRRAETDRDEFFAAKDAKKAAHAERMRANRASKKASSIDVHRENPAPGEGPRADSLTARADSLTARADSLTARAVRESGLTVIEPPENRQRTATGGTLPPDPLRQPDPSGRVPSLNAHPSGPPMPPQDQHRNSLPHTREPREPAPPNLRLIDGDGQHDDGPEPLSMFPALAPDPGPSDTPHTPNTTPGRAAGLGFCVPCYTSGRGATIATEGTDHCNWHHAQTTHTA